MNAKQNGIYRIEKYDSPKEAENALNEMVSNGWSLEYVTIENRYNIYHYYKRRKNNQEVFS